MIQEYDKKQSCLANRMNVTLITLLMIMSGMFGAAFNVAEAAASTVTLRYGKDIAYGSGIAGHTSIKWVTHIDGKAVDLDDEPGVTRSFAYCVQPTADPPAQGTYNVTIVDDDDTGRISKMRKLIYYLPGSYGFAKKTEGKWFSNYSNNQAYAIGHLALSWIYDKYSNSYSVWGGAPDSMVNKAKGIVDDLKNLADPPDDYEVFWVKVSGKQDVFGAFYKTEYGKADINKSSAIPEITKNNSGYSLKGAEYTIYEDASCKNKASTRDGSKAVLTVGANGKSETLELETGTYYVKETKAPAGYILDTEVHRIEVVNGKTATLEVKDVPRLNFVGSLIQKLDSESNGGGNQGDATLEGAVYKFSYYDGQYANSYEARMQGNPKAEWYFVTDSKGVISGEESDLAEGYTSSPLYKDLDGRVGFPIGTYVIQEVEPSKGYLINKEIKAVRIKDDGKDTAYLATYNQKTSSSEDVIRGGVRVAKIDNDLDEAYAQGDATLEGAEFTIYNKSAEYVKTGPKMTEKDEAALVIKTDANGTAESAANALPYGTYYIKETKAPEGYLLNESWSETFTIREQGEIKDFTSNAIRELVKRGGVQIIKRDKELQKSEAIGGGTLDGIVMTIKNVSAHDVVVRSDVGNATDKVDWKKLSSKVEMLEAGTIKRVEPGEDVGKIVTHWNEEKKAYTAETLPDDLPYGTYTIRESKTNNSYQRTDKTEHKFEVREDGSLYAYDNGFEDILTFDDYVYRSDLQGTKIGNGDSRRFSFVPFKITSVTNNETHVIVADKNGFFSTKDRRTKDGLDEDEDADTARKQNPFDDLLTAKDIKREDLEKRYTDILMGVWFGTGEAGSLAEKNDSFGALPYDSYVIEEMYFDGNESYTLQKFYFTVDEKSQNGFVDLETITNDIPEIGTRASVDGSNAEVRPNKEIVLTDTIEYKNLIKGKTYTARGKLIDKTKGEVVKDAAGKEITAEAVFETKKKDGKVKVEFKFDGSNMYGKETVVFETVYDAEGHVMAKHEDIDDEDQTVTWEELKPSYEMYKIRTTKAPAKGDKYGFFAQDEVEYEVHVENTGNVVLSMDVSDKFTEGESYFTKPVIKDVKFDGAGSWNNKQDGVDNNETNAEKTETNVANITINPGERAVITYTAVVSDEAGEYLAAAAADSDSLDDKGKDTNMEYQKNVTDDEDGYRNEASCENVTYPNPDNPDEPGTLEPKKDEAQTPVQKPSIGTTLTDTEGNKEVVTSEETTLVDIVEYRNLDKSKWYVITGTLMVKDTGDPLVENGKEITVTSEPFNPINSSGKQAIVFVIDTRGLEGKELVAFETCYRLDDYKKGDDVSKAKMTTVAEHKDINDMGQTVIIVNPEEPVPPTVTKTPNTGDGNRLQIYILLTMLAFIGFTVFVVREMLNRRREQKEYLNSPQKSY